MVGHCEVLLAVDRTLKAVPVPSPAREVHLPKTEFRDAWRPPGISGYTSLVAGRSLAQKIGTRGHKWLAAKIESNPDWLLRYLRPIHGRVGQMTDKWLPCALVPFSEVSSTAPAKRVIPREQKRSPLEFSSR